MVRSDAHSRPTAGALAGGECQRLEPDHRPRPPTDSRGLDLTTPRHRQDQPADSRTPRTLLPNPPYRRRQGWPPAVGAVGQEGPQHPQSSPVRSCSLAADPQRPGVIAHTPRVEPHQHNVPDLDTVAAIIEVADPRMAVIIRLAIATGARRGELGALKWSDIDYHKRLITFQRSVVDGGPASKVKPTKTRTTGIVSVGEATVASIETWRAHQTAVSEKAEFGPLDDDGWVFPSQDWGHPISLNQITYDWRTLADAHGLDGVRFHDLRHGTATHLIANGTDVRTVAGRLRHASPTMTLDVYAARTTKADQAAGQLIDDLLDNP